MPGVVCYSGISFKEFKIHLYSEKPNNYYSVIPMWHYTWCQPFDCFSLPGNNDTFLERLSKLKIHYEITFKLILLTALSELFGC